VQITRASCQRMIPQILRSILLEKGRPNTNCDIPWRYAPPPSKMPPTEVQKTPGAMCPPSFVILAKAGIQIPVDPRRVGSGRLLCSHARFRPVACQRYSRRPVLSPVGESWIPAFARMTETKGGCHSILQARVPRVFRRCHAWVSGRQRPFAESFSPFPDSGRWRLQRETLFDGTGEAAEQPCASFAAGHSAQTRRTTPGSSLLTYFRRRK
jgi:hypothetical protein